jgi:hypothetical protein
MDPSSPDFFRQLRLTLQLPLIAICSGVGRAVYCIAAIGFRKILSDLLTWPRGLVDFVRLLSVIWFLSKQIPNPGVFSSFIFPPKMEEDFEMEYERALPRRTRYLLPGLRTMAYLATFWHLRDSSDIFLALLRAFSSEPSWILQLLYSFVVLELISMLTPDISIGFFGPSITALLIFFLVYPYEAWIRRKRRMLSDTFIAGPTRAGNPAVSLPAFQYDPITKPGVFRLLKLTPVGGRMSVALENFPTDDCPLYWAVSYVWGSDKMDHALIFGVKGESYLPITESCATVLALLTPLQTRYLWIDAICINQADLTEKALQIPLMSEIYPGAQQVVGCLATNEIPAGQIPLSQSFLFDLIRYLRFNPDATGLRLPYRHRIPDWAGFCLLLSHTYWQRVWIVQEMVLAKKLIFVYGEATFSWRQYCYAINHLYERITSDKVPNKDSILKYVPLLFVLLVGMSDRLDMLSELKQSVESRDKSERPSLAQVADQLYMVLSTDPRDQIYALLSLASDGGTLELKPNYDQSITFEDVITKVTLHSFEEGHLNFFLGAGLAYRYEDDVGSDLPSWVPAFPKPMRPREGNWAVHKARKITCHLQYSISADNKELSLRGAVADEVAVLCTVSLAVPPGKLNKAYEETLSSQGDSSTEPDVAGWYNHVFLGPLEKLPEFLRATYRLATQYVPEQYQNNTRREDAYWRAMAMDWDGVGKGGTSPASWDTLSIFMDMVTGYVFKDTESLKRLIGQLAGKNFEKHPFNHWPNYDFAITRGGLMAWVPQGSRPGDVLCFFNGLDVPFSLRPTEVQESGQFYLIGDSYIHGLMRGEAKGLDVEDRWFKIV